MNISILQWNIWYQEDIRNIAQLIKSVRPDVFCLQELTLDHPLQEIKNTPQYLAQELGYHYYAQKIPIETTGGQLITLANGIFSRFPIKSSHYIWINDPTAGGGYEDEYRAYVEVALDVNGNRLTVGTTHMSYTNRFEETPRKRQETDLLTNELRKQHERFIFTGDLNATPESYTITQINKVLKHAGPDMSLNTWTTKPFSYNGFDETQLNWRLDYVFTTPDLVARSARIVQSDFSDHLPVLVEVEM